MYRDLLRFVILFLVLCNIPGFLLFYFGPTYGSASSYLTSISLISYLFISKKKAKPVIPFIVFTLLYFIISGLNYGGDQIYFIKEFIRFSIVILGITEVMNNSNAKSIFFTFLLVGFSIIIHALIFPEINHLYGLVKGRYSGFFHNPNTAALVCLLGMAMSFSIKNNFWKYFGQVIFTFAGVLTLSRTFIVVWVLINLAAIVNNRKNVIVPLIGVISMIVVFTFVDDNIFASDRFDALTSFITEGEVKSKTIGKDTRDQTWALYYDLVLEKPIFGHGFMVFQEKKGQYLPGVHNSFLMVLGESGILPFLVFLGIYFYLSIKSFGYFRNEPTLFYITMVCLLNLMVSHTYFTNYQTVALSIYVYLRLRSLKSTIDYSRLAKS